MRFRAVLFDFDGTLTPSLPLWVKAFRIALGRFGVELDDRDIVRRFFYRDWAEVAQELRIESAAVLQAEINAGLRIAFNEAELFPDVIEILDRCRDRGLQVALVTSAPRFVLDDVLPRLALHASFDHVVCADDVQNFKPHPEPVLMTLAALGRDAREAIMIGDSTADILAGKSAGTATALFLPDTENSFHHIGQLRATDPDHIFGEHRELSDILGLS
jgi:pyrophosphatase PpaX